MLILHAGIIRGRVQLWSEEQTALEPQAPRRSGRSPRASAAAASARHPYGCHYDSLFDTLHGLFPQTIGGERKATSLNVWLPTENNAPTASSQLLRQSENLVPPQSINPWRIYALPLTGSELSRLIMSAENQHILYPGVFLGEEFRFFSHALRFAVSLVVRQQYLPSINQFDGSYFAVWRPVIAGADQTQLLELAGMMPDVVRALSPVLSTDIAPSAPPLDVLSEFLDSVVDELVRASASESPTAKRLGKRAGPPATLSRKNDRDAFFDSVHDCWLAALKSANGLMLYDSTQLAKFAPDVSDWQQPITALTLSPFRLCFRLEEPTPELLSKRSRDRKHWTVRYLLQAAGDPSLLIPAEAAWQGTKASATMFKSHAFKPREYLLLALGQASMLCAEIADSLRANRFDGHTLDDRGAFEFLAEKAAVLEQAGFGVILASWWRKGATQARVRLKARAKGELLAPQGKLTLETIVQFNWKAAIGDNELSLEELLAIAEMKAPLVNIRGQWVHVSGEEIKAAIEFIKTKRLSSGTVRDALNYTLGAASPFQSGDAIDIDAYGWLADLLKDLQQPATLKEVPVPEEFHGTLRPYQQRGFSWLTFLARWGLGACLADDMGLGKTVQTLVMLQQQRNQGQKSPVLLICPTSVVSNWVKEMSRFTPQLSALVHHGGSRTKGDKFAKLANEHAIVISSYALLHRDFAQLETVEWAGIILDEAQNIKNHETKQALAAKKLKGQFRVALTGTPVENNIGDLWSIMQFLNPGLLGNQAAFRERFFYPIQIARDADAKDQLKRITQPFMLRRMKTDKSIINDLPEKQEMKVYCSLTKEQATLYTAVLKDLEKKLATSEGIERKGLILATLSKLKQVCNHPVHFLADNSELANRSGKLNRFMELIAEVLSGGERALVFTQFTEMAQLLKYHFEQTLGEQALYLHGGTPRAQRDSMVERFQSGSGPPLFILSLKAGGTGLNLTAANHVFHFDRWWNPAVENQATDRAFRIGQTKMVQVRKFICVGTMEEKIDDMIESKRQLADDIVGAGEGWLTELSNEQLRNVFSLSKEAFIDE